MKLRKKISLMFQIGCTLAGPILIVFFTAMEMWKDLFKFSIYMALAFVLSHFEVLETIKWKWNREKRKGMLDDETDSLH